MRRYGERMSVSGFASFGIVHIGLFCTAVLLLNVTPGPDTAFIVGQSVAHGRRAGLMAVLGISAGCMVHTTALALGLSALLAASASAFTIIKVAGAAYLCFLGARLIVGTIRRRPAEVGQDMALRGDLQAAHPSPRRTFVQGFATNVLNPKVVLFFLSFFPQFVSVSSESKPLAFVILGVVLIMISTIYNGMVAWMAGSITRKVGSIPRVKTWLDRSIGAAFVALGARLAFADR
jgi:threonine/homoserine/homoserine lactone efflux protein